MPIVKNVIEIESYNLAQANITNPFYIIPLVRFDDKDVAEYLNKDNIHHLRQSHKILLVLVLMRVVLLLIEKTS